MSTCGWTDVSWIIHARTPWQFIKLWKTPRVIHNAYESCAWLCCLERVHSIWVCLFESLLKHRTQTHTVLHTHTHTHPRTHKLTHRKSPDQAQCSLHTALSEHYQLVKWEFCGTPIINLASTCLLSQISGNRDLLFLLLLFSLSSSSIRAGCSSCLSVDQCPFMEEGLKGDTWSMNEVAFQTLIKNV